MHFSHKSLEEKPDGILSVRLASYTFWGRESSSSIHFLTSTTLYVDSPVLHTTVHIPAFIMSRRHMAQEVVSGSIAFVLKSRPDKYIVAPIIRLRSAEIMAFASACTLRQSSYRSPDGILSCSRVQ